MRGADHSRRLGPKSSPGGRARGAETPAAPARAPSRLQAGNDSVEVYLFGRMRVDRGGRGLPDLTCAKARELLAFLLLNRDRPQRREAVADRLWGHDDSGDPRKTLRQALWRLRSEVGTEAPLFEANGDEWLQVSPGAQVWLDVAVFEAAWCEVVSCADCPLSEQALGRVRSALGLYRGELLDGSDWDWCHFERLRLQDLYFAMADSVMSSHLAAGDPTSGFGVALEILRHDPAREKTHRQLMHLHAMAGDRSAALRQFDRCAAALREELGVEPSQATRELFERIREGRLTLDHHEVAGEPQAGVTSVLDGLRHLRQLLSEARREVHVEIEAIERTFGRPE